MQHRTLYNIIEYPCPIIALQMDNPSNRLINKRHPDIRGLATLHVCPLLLGGIHITYVLANCILTCDGVDMPYMYIVHVLTLMWYSNYSICVYATVLVYTHNRVCKSTCNIFPVQLALEPPLHQTTLETTCRRIWQRRHCSSAQYTYC